MDKKRIISLVVIILFIVGFLIFHFLKSEVQPQFVEGEELLEVIILGPDNNPIQNIEVDLWVANNPNGPPTAGYAITNNEGKSIFKIPEGNYLISFNGYNFPKEFTLPDKTFVNVKKGENQETIILEINN